jgi:hypothetical protein
MINQLDHYVNDLRGKRFVIYGFAALWPRYLSPYGLDTHLASRGAIFEGKLSPQTDYVVIGDGREKGKADAERKAEKLRKQGHPVKTLTTHQFFHLLRPELTGLRFAFTGGFQFQAADLEEEPGKILSRYGAVAADALTPEVDILVVGERRAQGKTAALREVEDLNKAGANIQMLDEDSYYSLIAVMAAPQDKLDLVGFVVQMRGLIDTKRTDRAIQMLKEESYKLYAEVQPDSVAGIVKSQSSANRYYASWIQSDGKYGCYDHGLSRCFGLQGAICKHILVLLIGLTRSGDLGSEQALQWVTTGRRKSPSKSEDQSALMLLRYKGVEAGEIDWRPTETVPEDYYLL